MLEPCVSDCRLGHYSGMHVYGKGEYIAKIGGISEEDTEKWESKKEMELGDTDDEYINIYKLPRRFCLPRLVRLLRPQRGSSWYPHYRSPLEPVL